MIGVSWMPVRRTAKHQSSLYNPRRLAPRVGRVNGARPYSLHLAIFGRSAALPTARLQGGTPSATLAAAVRGWLASARQWLRPRLVPLVFAGLGLLAILGSTAWLRRLATETPASELAPPPGTSSQRMYIDQDGHHHDYRLVQR